MSTENPPLISTIIAVYNGSETLQQCLDSVTQQTYKNTELIVIDGGSTDGTVDLLTANQENIAYWISEPDRGIYNAWNKALTQARGDWICFLGADDFFWNERVLAQMSEQLQKLPPSIRVAYGQVMLLSAAGKAIYPVGESWRKIKRRFGNVMCIPHQGVMHRRSLFEERGAFDETYRIAGDYELLLRELKMADAMFIPDLITTGMRQGGISSNPANNLIAMREIRRAQRKHGQRLPGWTWLMAVARVYIRAALWSVLGEQWARKFTDLSRRLRGLPSYWTKT